ncbi:hypothetical protein GN244_ATG13199 [Phytophthora infestans]|uniref:Uncharacterized protein n=1 Tax=Phytophthora infestans TaxID=4787 RepID=A0A833WAF7_PHYIN|nr:hypothetical protein GN244_ATG13199 [Phytophthora infestans]KAF4149600.1 hypothetical protein GN958_ATG01184 [Phytophthora infestans]
MFASTRQHGDYSPDGVVDADLHDGARLRATQMLLDISLMCVLAVMQVTSGTSGLAYPAASMHESKCVLEMGLRMAGTPCLDSVTLVCGPVGIGWRIWRPISILEYLDELLKYRRDPLHRVLESSHAFVVSKTHLGAAQGVR